MHDKTKSAGQDLATGRLPARSATLKPTGFATGNQLKGMLKFSSDDIRSGRYRIKLYRFLAEQIPSVAACIWTWSRLTAAPGEFDCQASSRAVQDAARERLQLLLDRIYVDPQGRRLGQAAFMTELTTGLFRDGTAAGFVTVYPDADGIDSFVPVDVAAIVRDGDRGAPRLQLETDARSYSLERPDFYYLPLGGGPGAPLGRSVLAAIPFVSYIEQQLVDDMRRTSHNSGYHRMHVRITPPERMAGEAEAAYVERINGYFDSTVRMIGDCDVNDNPVTWDNVAIEYIGPNASKTVSNSWFFNHRAMIEEICAGTNLAPFLLGYSYGATTTWAGFKFDLVMRQVRVVQRAIARFLEWLGSIELALAGIDARCEYRFDNTFSYEAADKAAVESQRVTNLVRLFESGLIEREVAARQAERLLK